MQQRKSCWVFNDFDSEDLMEAVELSRRLGELGFPNLPDDQMLEIERELKSRGMMF
jgi:hypothetical protein